MVRRRLRNSMGSGFTWTQGSGALGGAGALRSPGAVGAYVIFAERVRTTRVRTLSRHSLSGWLVSWL